MPSTYSHLSEADRLYIEVFHRHGVAKAGIARALNRHPSTIGREFARARSLGLTTGHIAHFGQLYRGSARRRAGLAAERSPQEIAGGLRAQRRSNEKSNGMMGEMPRELLGFKTPHEVFFRLAIDQVD